MSPTASTVDEYAWNALLQAAEQCPGTRPGKRWWARATALLETLGQAAFRTRLADLLESSGDPPCPGLLVMATRVDPDERLLCALGARAERGFRRIPDRGPADRPTATLCIKALGAAGTRGAAELDRLKRVVRYTSGRDRIESALDGIAADHGVTRQELEELTVPYHGLDGSGSVERVIAGITAKLSLDAEGDPSVVWITETGRRQKTVPAKLRREFPEGLAQIRELERRVGRELGAQRARLEHLLREGRSWSFAAWSVRYAEHPLVGFMARRLIWRFDRGEETIEAIFRGSRWVDAESRAVHDLDQARVSLWHPAEVSEERRLMWRRLIEAAGVRQPFRQANREVFPLGIEDGVDPERSMRFAGRVVRQQQFAALARRRSWEYTLQGPYCSSDVAELRLSGLGLVAELHVPRLDPYPVPDDMVDPFVSIGGLTFRDAHRTAVPLATVEPATYSEVLRDASLFTEVAAAAKTPAYADAPPELRRAYERALFTGLTEAGTVRRDLLDGILRQHGAPDRLALDDCSLRVRGDLATYRVHLDTAQVLIAPDGPPTVLLTALVRRAGEAVAARLAIDDPILGLILGAAACLANDAAIDDPVFRLQLETAVGADR